MISRRLTERSSEAIPIRTDQRNSPLSHKHFGCVPLTEWSISLIFCEKSVFLSWEMSMYETLILSVLIHTLLHPARTRLYKHAHMRTRKVHTHKTQKHTWPTLSLSVPPPLPFSHTQNHPQTHTHAYTQIHGHKKNGEDSTKGVAGVLWSADGWDYWSLPPSPSSDGTGFAPGLNSYMCFIAISLSCPVRSFSTPRHTHPFLHAPVFSHAHTDPSKDCAFSPFFSHISMSVCPTVSGAGFTVPDFSRADWSMKQ